MLEKPEKAGRENKNTKKLTVGVIISLDVFTGQIRQETKMCTGLSRIQIER